MPRNLAGNQEFEDETIPPYKYPWEQTGDGEFVRKTDHPLDFDFRWKNGYETRVMCLGNLIP